MQDIRGDIEEVLSQKFLKSKNEYSPGELRQLGYWVAQRLSYCRNSDVDFFVTYDGVQHLIKLLVRSETP